jgi:hypothetical protein
MEILNQLNIVVSEDTLSTSQHIYRVHKEFYGIQNESLNKLNKDTVCYGDYIHTETIKPIFNVINDTELKGVILIKPQIRHIDNNIRNKIASVAFKGFRISSTEGIESINIIIGTYNRLDNIPIDIFDTMCHVYDIPTKNNDNFINIPSYISVSGCPGLTYHNLEFELVFNKEYSSKNSITELNKFYFKYDVHYSSRHETERNIYLTYQISSSYLYNKSPRIHFNHPVFYLLIKDPSLKTLKLRFNNNEVFIINLERKSLIGDYSVFSFVDHLKDFDHSINFSRIDITEIMSDIKTNQIYSICSQEIAYANGMACIRFSK